MTTRPDRGVHRRRRDAARRRRLLSRAREAFRLGLSIVAPDIAPPERTSSLDRRVQRQLRAAVQAIVGRSVVGVFLVMDE